jgi:sugar lactone lactonase YvrE
VYRVTPSGDASRLPGTEAIGFANGVAFGDRGTLYVTDSMVGKVWRIPKGGTAEEWVQSSLLEGDDSAPLPFPIGANGITYRHRTVYVTNTELGSIVAIPVTPGGSAGTPEVLIQSPALGGADGVALDVRGNLHVAVIAQSTIVKVAPDGSSLEVLADGDDDLDYVSSVAFGSGHGERRTLYAVNFSVGPLFGDVRTSGPRLLAVEAGVPGLPQP